MSKKIIAGLLAIFLGALGVHKFVIGANRAGLIMLMATLLTCGTAGLIMGAIGLIEGIIYLTRSDEEFICTYEIGKREWF